MGWGNEFSATSYSSLHKDRAPGCWLLEQGETHICSVHLKKMQMGKGRSVWPQSQTLIKKIDLFVPCNGFKIWGWIHISHTAITTAVKCNRVFICIWVHSKCKPGQQVLIFTWPLRWYEQKEKSLIAYIFEWLFSSWLYYLRRSWTLLGGAVLLEEVCQWILGGGLWGFIASPHFLCSQMCYLSVCLSIIKMINQGDEHLVFQHLRDKNRNSKSLWVHPGLLICKASWRLARITQ